ncbi:RNA-binding protein [Paenisporosarcina cavernae]|uniref:RNA-binding protein n=1 Tax=Paenisporosarcina cavernae TaxID=2320858 RepID=A0A385YRQ1_9BACL|nr:RNA-binding protein [Paenisporosarcina cavernae]AYC29174.1 RNA-binding protein [Paenisporosarcina cavernae]
MEHLIQHFRKEEQPFIEQVVGWVRETEDRYAPKRTDFLDPRERFIVESIVRQNEELVTFSEGVFQEAERARMFIAPSYFEPTMEDFDIVVFELHYASKFLSLHHQDVLGSLMSLGLERSKYGDIRVLDEKIQFAVAKEVADFVRLNVTSVGKAKVQLQEIDSHEPLIFQAEEWTEEMHLVSSMRLDTIVASILSISRQKAATFIHGGKIKVNWTVRDNPSFEVHESDMLSIRGAGRIRVGLIEGRTKKDKIRLQIERIDQSS